jgi:hypothetical protein
MKETKRTYVSDCQRLFPIRETSQVRDLFKPSEGEYQKRGIDQSMINKDLADDHLTATYWG